ncbi:transposable element Tcb1 transposase [Trichonephila clavipes]|nr:transposable element Tcb1 transposase [Trichonephila clavipes]
MIEARWSARRVDRQLRRSDCVVRRCWDHWCHIPHTAPTAGVMEWGVIAYNTRSPLVLIRDTMRAYQYVHDILQPHVLPLMQRFPGAILQQYNARPLMARVSQDCLCTVTACPLAAYPPIFLQSSISGIIWDGELGIP